MIPRWLRWLIISTLLLAMCALAAFKFLSDWHPSDREYPRQGIDVSHHQKTIDWSKLKAQGVDFAYIKASEGGDYRDDRFAEYWAAAGRAGIARGAYHYFTLCRPGALQAANFIAAVPYDPNALPPVVDVEFLGNCTTAQVMDKEAFHREMAAYLAAVEGHFRKPVIFYMTDEFDRAYAVSARIHRPLWLRSIWNKPDFGARPWHIWQTSNFRRLDGIDGRVDWNVMRD